jgi:tRNA pseudouridine55 synthase
MMNEEHPYKLGTILLMDKPFGWTSFDLVNKVRIHLETHYRMKRRSLKVGHAGTLDPLATGLMIICTGKMTKQIESLQGLPKTYTGTFTLGGTTASFDLEKLVDKQFPIEHITEEKIYEAAKSFVGVHDQVPPVFSAKKIDGSRAYEFARKGEEVQMKTARIEITSFEITRINLPEVEFSVSCTKGTYIRSLARDFGLALESGAYLSALRRTAVGEYRLKDAISVEGLKALLEEKV